MKKLLVLTFLLAACGQQANTTITPLYVYGDSISAGGTYGYTYTDIIAAANGWFEVNKSIGGTELTSPNQYSLIWWDSVISNRWEPNAVVMFTPGVNDSGLNGSDPAYLATYTTDMNKIMTYITTKGVKAYIGTPTTHCNEAHWGVNAEAPYADINTQAVISSNNPNIILVDYYSKFVPTTDNTVDCLHPNILGYQQMAQIYFNTVRN